MGCCTPIPEMPYKHLAQKGNNSYQREDILKAHDAALKAWQNKKCDCPKTSIAPEYYIVSNAPEQVVTTWDQKIMPQTAE